MDGDFDGDFDIPRGDGDRHEGSAEDSTFDKVVKAFLAFWALTALLQLLGVIR